MKNMKAIYIKTDNEKRVTYYLNEAKHVGSCPLYHNDGGGAQRYIHHYRADGQIFNLLSKVDFPPEYFTGRVTSVNPYSPYTLFFGNLRADVSRETSAEKINKGEY